MTEDKLATVQPTAMQSAEHQQAGLLTVIARAAQDPTVDVDKLERLLAIQERMMVDARRTAFMSALAELQAELPQIAKTGRIVVKGTERSRYAKLEDIDQVIRPFLKAHGFAFSFDADSKDGRLYTFTAKLTHREGHFETKTLMLPIDKSDYRSDVQSIGSSESYAKRRLIKMHLNIIERDEDDDGNGGRHPITHDQAAEIRALITSSGANEPRFLNWAAAPSVEEIPAGNYKRCVDFLKAKAAGGGK